MGVGFGATAINGVCLERHAGGSYGELSINSYDSLVGRASFLPFHSSEVAYCASRVTLVLPFLTGPSVFSLHLQQLQLFGSPLREKR